MSGYDAWKTDAPELDDEPAPPCKVCNPVVETDEVCGEPCAYVAELQHVLRTVDGYYAACRASLKLARLYREEEGPGGRREVAVVRQVRAYRDEIAMCRFGKIRRQVDEIRSRRSGGERVQSLAIAFGVSLSAVENIIYGRSWRSA